MEINYLKILNQLKQSTVGIFLNSLGWHTKRKIVVIESDDWGMIRVSGQKAFKNLEKAGYGVHRSPYTKYDMLESNQDVALLLDVLSKFKDKHGNPPVFTLNNIVANPDFDKIRESGFQKYYYEKFTDTYLRYPDHDKVFSLLKEGQENGFFKPQLHGREHMNVHQWMSALKRRDKSCHFLFEQEMFSAYKDGHGSCKNEFLLALGRFAEGDLEIHKSIIRDGAQVFEDIWGFRSRSFIAPCYAWSRELEPAMADIGIKYLQGIHVQKDLHLEKRGRYFKKRYHYLGETNSLQQKYIIRNCWFEPSQHPGTDNLSVVLKQIDKAFRFNKPAVICSHRLNYMGSMVPQNRDGNLQLLAELLKVIVHKWSEVEFLSTDQLGDLIAEDRT